MHPLPRVPRDGSDRALVRACPWQGLLASPGHPRPRTPCPGHESGPGRTSDSRERRIVPRAHSVTSCRICIAPAALWRHGRRNMAWIMARGARGCTWAEDIRGKELRSGREDAELALLGAASVLTPATARNSNRPPPSIRIRLRPKCAVRVISLAFDRHRRRVSHNAIILHCLTNMVSALPSFVPQSHHVRLPPARDICLLPLNRNGNVLLFFERCVGKIRRTHTQHPCKALLPLPSGAPRPGSGQTTPNPLRYAGLAPLRGASSRNGRRSRQCSIARVVQKRSAPAKPGPCEHHLRMSLHSPILGPVGVHPRPTLARPARFQRSPPHLRDADARATPQITHAGHWCMRAPSPAVSLPRQCQNARCAMVAGPIVSCFRRACFYRRTLGARRVASGRGTLPIAHGYHWADISPSTPWAGQIWEPRSIWHGSSLHLASSTPAQPPAGGNVGLYPLWRSPRSHPRPTSFPPFCPGFCTHDGSAYWPVVLPPCLLRRKITLCPDVPLHSARHARCRGCAGLAPPPPTRRCERRDIHTYTYTSAEMAGPQPCWRPVHVQENFRALLVCVCVRQRVHTAADP